MRKRFLYVPRDLSKEIIKRDLYMSKETNQKRPKEVNGPMRKRFLYVPRDLSNFTCIWQRRPIKREPYMSNELLDKHDGAAGSVCVCVCV